MCIWVQNLGVHQMIRKSKYLLIIYLLHKDVHEGQSSKKQLYDDNNNTHTIVKFN